MSQQNVSYISESACPSCTGVLLLFVVKYIRFDVLLAAMLRKMLTQRVRVAMPFYAWTLPPKYSRQFTLYSQVSIGQFALTSNVSEDRRNPRKEACSVKMPYEVQSRSFCA
jgi:hypothetical protein